MSLSIAIMLFVFELSVLLWIIIYFISGVTSALHGAPYMPMRDSLVHRLLSFGEVRSGDVFYDFGSCDGRVLLSAVKDFKVARATGYEIAPWPYWKSRWLIRRTGYKNISVYQTNFFTETQSDATCIYAY